MALGWVAVSGMASANVPPNPPVLSSFNGAKIPTAAPYTYALRVTVSDPDGDATRPVVDWGDGTTTTATAFAGTGHTVIFVRSFPVAGTWQMTARTEDPSGAVSDPSQPLAVTAYDQVVTGVLIQPSPVSVVKGGTRNLFGHVTDQDGLTVFGENPNWAILSGKGSLSATCGANCVVFTAPNKPGTTTVEACSPSVPSVCGQVTVTITPN